MATITYDNVIMGLDVTNKLYLKRSPIIGF